MHVCLPTDNQIGLDVGPVAENGHTEYQCDEHVQQEESEGASVHGTRPLGRVMLFETLLAQPFANEEQVCHVSAV